MRRTPDAATAALTGRRTRERTRTTPALKLSARQHARQAHCKTRRRRPSRHGHRLRVALSRHSSGVREAESAGTCRRNVRCNTGTATRRKRAKPTPLCARVATGGRQNGCCSPTRSSSGMEELVEDSPLARSQAGNSQSFAAPEPQEGNPGAPATARQGCGRFTPSCRPARDAALRRS